MEFKAFRDAIATHFNQMCKSKKLFIVDVTADEMWQTYLGAFSKESDPLHITNTKHNCHTCRHFIRDVGLVVGLDEDLKLTTIWDVAVDEPYADVAAKMSELIRSKPIKNKWFPCHGAYGTHCNYGKDYITTYFHYRVEVPRGFAVPVDLVDTKQGEFRSSYDVFYRAMVEWSQEALATVMELCVSKSLYRGETYVKTLRQVMNVKANFDRIKAEDHNKLVMLACATAPTSVTHVYNSSIGTLITDVTEGMDLDEAVKKFEAIVAPANYKRPKAVFTAKMLQEAKKELEAQGYMPALQRRFAKLDDITVNNILFSNKDSAKVMKDGNDLFAKLEKQTKATPKKFSNVEEMSMDKFVTDVLPTATEIEAYVENRMAGNFVSLIGPSDTTAPSMFQWNNNFSWAYSGNVADSMKQRVKEAGGNISGDVRFSLQWNDSPSTLNESDLDAHCSCTDLRGVHAGSIHFANKKALQGELDVDIRFPRGKVAVENISFPSIKAMPNGKYSFGVHVYDGRSPQQGFKAELEVRGEVYRFEHKGTTPTDATYRLIELVKKGDKTDVEIISKKTYVKEFVESPMDIWNVKTCTFIPVSVVMHSPNYWDEQQGIGHKHYFFMLKDCKNPDTPNGFFNEFLKSGLEKHRRVFEALGSASAVTQDSEQLSGIGFSCSKRDSLTLKVKGNTERVIKVLF